MKKKGMTISINMIIILIIAIVTLMVALSFITGFLPELLNKVKGFPTLEIEPTADEPITFIPATFQRGKETKVSIGFYNYETADIDNTITPSITCLDISEVIVKASGLNIPVGEFKKYAALTSIPKDTPSGQYSCTMTISNTEKTFFAEVE